MDTEVRGELADGPLARRVHRPPLQHLRGGVASQRTTFSARSLMGVPFRVQAQTLTVATSRVALGITVMDVAGLGIDKQVLRPHTVLHVAVVADDQLVGDRTIEVFPDNAVGTLLIGADAKGGIAVAETGSGPQPAIAGLVDFRPEPWRQHMPMLPLLSSRDEDPKPPQPEPEPDDDDQPEVPHPPAPPEPEPAPTPGG